MAWVRATLVAVACSCLVAWATAFPRPSRRVSCSTADFLLEGDVPTVYTSAMYDASALVLLAPPNATTPSRVTLAWGSFEEAVEGNFGGFKTVTVPPSFISNPTVAYPGTSAYGAIFWGGCYYLTRLPGTSMLCLESGFGPGVTYSRPYMGYDMGQPGRVEYFGSRGGEHYFCSQTFDLKAYETSANCTSIDKPDGMDHVRIIRVNDTWGAIFFGKSELVFGHACQYEFKGKDLTPKITVCRNLHHYVIPRGDCQYQADMRLGHIPIIQRYDGVYSVSKLGPGLIASPGRYNISAKYGILALPSTSDGVHFARFVKVADHWLVSACPSFECDSAFRMPMAPLKDILVNYKMVNTGSSVMMLSGFPKYGNVTSEGIGDGLENSPFPTDVLDSYIEITAPAFGDHRERFMFGITTNDSVQLCYGSVYAGPSSRAPHPTAAPNHPAPAPDVPGLAFDE